jgi:sugar lactone lactonase YvrE
MSQCQLVECPAWDPVKSGFWWADIRGAAVCRYCPDRAEIEILIQRKNVSGFTVNRAGGLVSARFDGLYPRHPQRGFELAATNFAEKTLSFDFHVTSARDQVETPHIIRNSRNQAALKCGGFVYWYRMDTKDKPEYFAHIVL